MTCGVYKIVHVKSGKFYIGSSQDIEKRIKRHFRELRLGYHHCSRLQKLYDKKPTAEFSIGKIKLKREAAYEKEHSLIQENFNNKKFLNIGLGVRGGDNLTRNPRRAEIIENIRSGIKNWMGTLSDADRKWLFGLRGEKNGMYGKTHTKEARSKIAKAGKGNQNAKGLKWSEDSKKKLSESLKDSRKGSDNSFYGKSHSAETKKRISEKKKGHKPANQKPIKIDKTIYPSASEASRQLGVPTVTIAWRARNTKDAYSNYQYV